RFGAEGGVITPTVGGLGAVFHDVRKIRPYSVQDYPTTSNRSLHRGYNATHADYNANMRQQLDDLDGLARRENWSPERMRQEVLALQHDTRKGLNTGTTRCH
ncbi:MAG TPA: hypothetical protein VF629_08860, partial [Hymenobacter sp.]|uniref:hypothetical protein n=1 Tax=Hymenobacter sp. TaxID=1898978 RepID=UPI002ED7F9CF